MEEITQRLIGVTLNEEKTFNSLSVVRELPNCVHYQKCFIPSYVMNAMCIKWGEAVFIEHLNRKYVARAFENFNSTDSIEIYGIVECTTNGNCCMINVEKIKTISTYSRIVVDLVCNRDNLFRWLSSKDILLDILKTRIMRNIMFTDKSVINFECFPEVLMMGLKKILIINTEPAGVGNINAETVIGIRQIFSEQHHHSSNISTQFYGSTRVVMELSEIIDLNNNYSQVGAKLFPPIKQILLAGPSGSGKTSLIHYICNGKQYPLVAVLGQDVHSKDPGQSEKYLRDVIEEVSLYTKIKGICILLLEDVDVICPQRRSVTPHTARLSVQLLSLLDRCQETSGVVVIATTNKTSDLHPGLRRHGRLSKEIFLGKPSESDRLEIITNFLNTFSYFSINENEDISKVIASITPGYLGADLKLLCQNACSKIITANLPPDKVLESIKIFRDVLLEMKPASLRNEVEVIPSGMSVTLGGLSDVKRQLELSVHCSLLQPHIYSRMGIEKPRGILLYGPPGCAKTSLVKSLSSNGNITVLYATNASIYSPYVGDAEKAIVNLFNNARQNTPAIIFIDEIDSLVGSRSGSNSPNDVQERVLAALLTQMDGIGISKEVADNSENCLDGDDVIVIAATNRPNEIDPALLRPGRFDRHLYIPPPDLQSRMEILSLLSRKTSHDKSVDLHSIALKTELYSGADLKNLHKEAVLHAMQVDGINVSEIKQSHYEHVLKIMKPSLSQGILQQYEKMF